MFIYGKTSKDIITKIYQNQQVNKRINLYSLGNLNFELFMSKIKN